MTGRAWLAGLLAVVAVGAFLIHETYSLDVWWQVAIGRSVLAAGAVPETGEFAAASAGSPYHDGHWLFQIFLANCFIKKICCTHHAARTFQL